MSVANVTKNYRKHLEAIEICIEKELIIPAQILIHTAIDSIAWMVNMKYEQWTKKYIISTNILPCKAHDLYSARNALLHTMTATSDQTDKGTAKKIMITYGPAKNEVLEKLISKIPSSDKYIAIPLNDLFRALKEGLLSFSEEVLTDNRLNQTFTERSVKHFEHIPTEQCKSLLAQIERNEQ